MILNGKMLNPGILRTTVTFERPNYVASGGNFQKPNGYTPIKSVKVKWTNAHGAEAIAAASLQANQTATILCRYIDTVNEGDTVLKGGKRFDITSIDNIQERGEWMEVKVKRSVNG